MIEQRKKYRVGLFVAGGFILGLLVVLWVGMASFFQKGSYCVTYFAESVQGLQIDSPVKYRGVTIGRVDKIRVAPDARLIEVLMEITGPVEFSPGISAQLKAVGITGSMFVEMDYLDPIREKQSPALNFTSDYPVISSRPSEITELFQSIDEVVRDIKAMDLEGISDRTKQTLDSVRLSVDGLETAKISQEMQQTFTRLHQSLASQPWEKIIEAVERSTANFDSTMARGRDSLARIDGLTQRLDELAGASEADLRAAVANLRQATAQARVVLGELDTASRGLSRATGTLNQGLETLADQPAQLLFTNPPNPETQGEEP